MSPTKMKFYVAIHGDGNRTFVAAGSLADVHSVWNAGGGTEPVLRIVGSFNTKRGAEYFAAHPECKTPTEAEKLSKQDAPPRRRRS